MKTLIAFLLMTLLSFSTFSMKVESYKIDTKSSNLKWTGWKAGGSSHWGTLPIQSGVVEFKGGDLVGGHVVINVDGMKVSDIEDPAMNTKLLNHLKNGDFFDVSKKVNKTARLDIKSATLGKGGRYDILANLTIKGVQKPISFSAKFKRNKNQVETASNLKFNRTQYGIKYNSRTFFGIKTLLDKYVIKDEIQLDFNLVAKK